MRQVTYLLVPDHDGQHAEEVMCIGEVPSAMEDDDEKDFWLKRMVKGTRGKGKM